MVGTAASARLALSIVLPVTAVVLLLVDVPVQAVSSFAGPYWLMVRNFSNCPRNEVGDLGDDITITSLMHHSPNHTKDIMFSGNATVKNDVLYRGNTKVTIDAAKWDTVSGWREHFMVMPLGEFCTAMEEVGQDVSRIITKFVPTIPRKCPIPNGYYSATSAPTRLGQLGHFPVLPYGRYRARIFGYYLNQQRVGRKSRGCLQVVVDVNPKT